MRMGTDILMSTVSRNSTDVLLYFLFFIETHDVGNTAPISQIKKQEVMYLI